MLAWCDVKDIVFWGAGEKGSSIYQIHEAAERKDNPLEYFFPKETSKFVTSAEIYD